MTATVVTPKRLLQAVPNTLGGKRNQAPAIFAALRAHGLERGSTLVDPFMGGGSVSLLAKLRGYRVLAGDTSPRAEAVAGALLVNSATQLEPDDVAVALTTEPAGWYLPPLKQLPWPEDSRQVLAGICRAAASNDNPVKAALQRALMVKLASHISIYGQPRMTAHQRIRERNWDALTDGQVTRMLGPQTRPREMGRRVAKSMYGVVFNGGQDCEFHRADVLEVLKRADRMDVVYLDPPYPDTEGYSRNYVGIDAILEGRELVIEEARFSQPSGWQHLRDVLAACEPAPLVVMSLGGENRHVTVEQLEELMREAGRTVETQAIEYALLHSRATAKSQRKREWLIAGKR